MRIGVDFGGTKIEAAALYADGSLGARVRVPTPAAYDLALAAVREVVARVEAASGPVAQIGVAMPGTVSPRTGTVRNANALCLNGRHFEADLAAVLHKPVRIANDANCFAISEAQDGAGEGARVVFGAILGTGCGGGVVVDGRLLGGANGVAGEWGHNPLPATSAAPVRCWCAADDCLETWISGSGLSRDFRERSSREASGQEIVSAAAAGDQEAGAALDAYVDRLGRALAGVVNLIDPDAIILGGGMSNVGQLYERLPDAVRRHVFGGEWEAPIRPARWGDSSGVRGAARLW